MAKLAMNHNENYKKLTCSASLPCSIGQNKIGSPIRTNPSASGFPLFEFLYATIRKRRYRVK